jgi:hypothetical protein
MELPVMQSGRRSRDDALVGRMLEKRRARIAAASGSTETVYLLHALVSDFKGLRDVSPRRVDWHSCPVNLTS